MPGTRLGVGYSSTQDIQGPCPTEFILQHRRSLDKKVPVGVISVLVVIGTDRSGSLPGLGFAGGSDL